MKKLAVIGANEPLLPFYEKAKALGFEIYAFAWEEGAVCKSLATKFFPYSFTQKDKILEECKRIGINGITSFSLESALPTVLYVAHAMRLVSNPLSTLNFTGNKFNLREKCKEQNIVFLKYWLISSEEDLNEQDFTFPLILKPCDGGGARGINLVNNKSELHAAFQNSLAFSKSKQIIAEQFIQGQEASAVFISFNGIHHYVTITDKKTSGFPNFIELEHSQPTIQPKVVVDRVKELVPKVLDAIGVQFGVTSIDLRITPSAEPIVIEVNPRMGGNMITSHLVELSTGFDIVKASCEIACGLNFEFPKQLSGNNAQVFFYSPYSLWVKDFFAVGIKNSSHEIVLHKLKALQNKCENNLDRSGFVVYSGKRIDSEI